MVAYKFRRRNQYSPFLYLSVIVRASDVGAGLKLCSVSVYVCHKNCVSPRTWKWYVLSHDLFLFHGVISTSNANDRLGHIFLSTKRIRAIEQRCIRWQKKLRRGTHWCERITHIWNYIFFRRFGVTRIRCGRKEGFTALIHWISDIYPILFSSAQWNRNNAFNAFICRIGCNMGFHCPAQRCVRQRLPVATQKNNYEVGKGEPHTHGRLTNRRCWFVLCSHAPCPTIRPAIFFSLDGRMESVYDAQPYHAQDKERWLI